MAHEYTTWAYAQPITPSGAKFILVALADTANSDGYSFPGQKRLAYMTGQSERSVREHLAHLEEAGYVKRAQRRRSDGTRTSDAYHLPPKDTSGNIRRWAPTGKSRQGHRQISPKSPAKSAGHEPSGEPPVEELHTSPHGDTREPTQIEKVEGQANSDTLQAIADAYNQHCGTLPKVQTLNEWRRTKLRGLIKDLGSHNEAIAVMGIAASEVAHDDFWKQRRYGFDNLLRERRAIQKAETAVNRGTTNREEAETNRLLTAIGGP